MNTTAAFDEIVASYREAAKALDLNEQHIRMAVIFAVRMEGKCASCAFSRARHDVVEAAMTRGVLEIYRRRCIFHRITDLVHCQHWQRLEAPEDTGLSYFAPVESRDACPWQSDRPTG